MAWSRASELGEDECRGRSRLLQDLAKRIGAARAAGVSVAVVVALVTCGSCPSERRLGSERFDLRLPRPVPVWWFGAAADQVAPLFAVIG
jgi:hypothetical protein